MTPFAQTVQEWQTFYATVAAASATLVGLLFVALAVSPAILTRNNTRGIRLLARETFTAFLYVIAIALAFLIPRAEPPRLGITLLIIGASGLLFTLNGVRSLYTQNVPAAERQSGLKRSIPGIISLLLLLLIGGTLVINANENALWWMIAPMLLFLITASLNTWVLLIAIQQASSRE